ncbi:PTB domain-containing engulfment adapter protein 1 isoform X2 [Brachyhypopomus gauderio]|uniref:PTB domain-containing engulfment adapter protein 1 isoform X2 n=1 Tax=Brachyhypopomus gauderio TaxID=698409 RepID=UPI004042443C
MSTMSIKSAVNVVHHGMLGRITPHLPLLPPGSLVSSHCPKTWMLGGPSLDPLSASFFTMNKAFGRRKDKPSMHHPEALVQHHVSYSAKFLGITEVDQPKGTDVVRVAVRKLKFQSHIKKSEGGKIPKVELQISIYGVKILDPKSKEVLHNNQLHRMSFCADDKTDKRIFAFICTESDTKRHLCYVFDSEKCAEEITVAIGQAFDLAYKKFLESGGKDVETRKQIGNLQKRIQDLEMENSKLKKQLQELEDQVLEDQLLLGDSPGGRTSQRSSMSSCGDDITSVASLEMSSVTLTPVSSPESNQSTDPLASPLAKPAHFQTSNVCSVPRPRAGSIPTRAPSTDIFDMVPFTPTSSMSRIPICNGTPPPPMMSPKNRGVDLFGSAPFDPFICDLADYTADVQSKLEEMQRQRWRGSKWV